jgi:hypothetical protein
MRSSFAPKNVDLLQVIVARQIGTADNNLVIPIPITRGCGPGIFTTDESRHVRLSCRRPQEFAVSVCAARSEAVSNDKVDDRPVLQADHGSLRLSVVAWHEELT